MPACDQRTWLRLENGMLWHSVHRYTAVLFMDERRWTARPTHAAEDYCSFVASAFVPAANATPCRRARSRCGSRLRPGTRSWLALRLPSRRAHRSLSHPPTTDGARNLALDARSQAPNTCSGRTCRAVVTDRRTSPTATHGAATQIGAREPGLSRGQAVPGFSSRRAGRPAGAGRRRACRPEPCRSRAPRT